MTSTPVAKSPSVIGQMELLIKQIDNECALKTIPCCALPCCTPCCVQEPPVPPLIIIPIPQAIPITTQPQKQVGAEEDPFDRHDNFYNNYNIDWRNPQGVQETEASTCKTDPAKRKGVTLDGKSACCDTPVPKKTDLLPAKPGRMNLFRPSCNESTPWCLKIELCPDPSKSC